MRIISIAAVAALALGACSPLTSNHPLFSVADQTGPAPLTEGVWTPLDENCTRDMALSPTPPSECDQLNVHRAGDGAWRLTARGKDENGVAQELDMRLLVAPAVATASADAYAPLYVVELSPRDTDAHSTAPADARIYAVIAPIGGERPARELFLTQIDCSAILRQGPIDGVTQQHNSDGSVSGCLAANQGAVREAGVRALIEDFDNVDRMRLIFVHP